MEEEAVPLEDAEVIRFPEKSSQQEVRKDYQHQPIRALCIVLLRTNQEQIIQYYYL